MRAVSRFEAERRRGVAPEPVTMILASEVDTTVASVLGVWRQLLRRPPRIVFSSSVAGLLQPRGLSFRSRVRPVLIGRQTLLPAGIEIVHRDQFARLMSHGDAVSRA